MSAAARLQTTAEITAVIRGWFGNMTAAYLCLLVLCSVLQAHSLVAWSRGAYKPTLAMPLPVGSGAIKTRSSRPLARPQCVLHAQRAEDSKVNCQIARLNAVAAKLRAEAAELEVN
jgi:hypothetical protein